MVVWQSQQITNTEREEAEVRIIRTEQVLALSWFLVDTFQWEVEIPPLSPALLYL